MSTKQLSRRWKSICFLISLRDNHSRPLMTMCTVKGNREGKPRLHPHVQPTEFAINQIKILMQTLARLRPQLELLPLAIRTNRERLTRLDRRQHTDQTVGDAVPLGDALGVIVFAKTTRVQILDPPPRLLGDLFTRLSNLLGEVHGIGFELLEQHTPMTQPLTEAS